MPIVPDSPAHPEPLADRVWIAKQYEELGIIVLPILRLPPTGFGLGLLLVPALLLLRWKESTRR